MGAWSVRKPAETQHANLETGGNSTQAQAVWKMEVKFFLCQTFLPIQEEEIEISCCSWYRFWTQRRMWINILKRLINTWNRWKWNNENIYSFLLVAPGLDSANWTMTEETDLTSWPSSCTQVLINRVSNCNIVDIFDANACMFVSGIKRSELCAFTGTLWKSSLVLLDSSRICGNIVAPSLQSKGCHQWSQQKGSHSLRCWYASATIFICGWSKRIHCCWTGVFVVASPARYTKHFKYLSRCILEALPLVSVGNPIPYLTKSRLNLLTVSETQLPGYCISKDLVFFLHQFNCMIMPFHKILIRFCLRFPPACLSVKHPHSLLLSLTSVPAFSSFLLCPVSLGIPQPLHFSDHHYSLQRHYWVLRNG